jgi:histidinol-phosphate/aromatic aminotransferase/cobyric acid decarboxylase-like protein
MNVPLSSDEKREFLKRGFSRRSFGRLATLVTAGAALPFYNESAMAQLSRLKGPVPSDAVMINANENPMGPCPEAADAMYNVIKKGGRYMYQETTTFTELLAKQEGVKSDYVMAFAGSSAPLHQAVLAFTSPSRSYVAGDPGYEAGGRAARFIGAPIHNVPLAKDYSHDVRAMVAADPNAGLIYICNPNNPTGTLTSRADIEWALANKPAGSILMVDEAYMHIAGSAPTTDLVAADKDIIVLRTFSKLYGMAGLRAGAAIARPDLLQKLSQYSAGAMPVTGMVGATASLNVPTLIPERRKTYKDIRGDVFAWMVQKNYKFVPSVSNKFMVDTGRPGGQVIEAMAREKVYIGRVWPSWPTYVRVTIGSKEDMAKFKVAFAKVMA